ncbi:hypothetical protein B5807_08851 [Epicoccum nigrum]|uniref:Uncharacterized protein n=1 Tax=Epicoccum nigrum TaxID=105696 RepID=A0A1Y2LSJ4_EPING|nr:hypothetical protein B5807_08851 [Epicoccum nigrum]
MTSPSIKYRVLDNDSSGDYSDDEVKGIPPFEARYLRSRSHEQQQKRARTSSSSANQVGNDRVRARSSSSRVQPASSVRPAASIQPNPPVQPTPTPTVQANPKRPLAATAPAHTSSSVSGPGNMVHPRDIQLVGNSAISFSLAFERGSR